MADINLASARAICLKCGISDELAQEIVRTRRRYGPFRCLADLWNVKGMSNVAVGVLESMYNINSNLSTRRLKKGRSSRSSERGKAGSSPSSQRGERRRSRSSSRHRKRVQDVAGDSDGGEMVSVAVVDVNGQEHATQAKSVHMEQSPSGNKLYIKCEGIRKYRIMDTPITEERGSVSATTTDSSSVQLKKGNKNHTGPNRRGGVELDPSSFSRDRNLTKLRSEFSKTENQFWNRIEESRRELEVCAGQLGSSRGKQTAKWVCSLPNSMQENARADTVFESQPLNLPGPSKQHQLPIKRHHHHPHRHRKEKSRKREEKDKKHHPDNAEADLCIIL